jgi:ribosomal-protein-alanine N-acetyltransferase
MCSETTPALDTLRLRLRPFAEQHLTERYVGWLNDTETMRFSENRHRRHTIESCRSYAGALHDAGHLFWAIERRSGEPPHIGNITAYLDPDNGVADVAILLGERSARGNGLGFEAFSAVCDWLSSRGTIRKVTAGTVSINRPMLAIMRHVGMVEDGVRRSQYMIDGTEVDLIHCALFVRKGS